MMMFRIALFVFLFVNVIEGGQAQTPQANIVSTPADNNGDILLCAGDSVVFEDASSDILPGATFSWSFGPTAVPQSATGPGPHVVHYPVPVASSQVLLVVDNGNGQGTGSATMNVAALQQPASNLTLSNLGIGFSTANEGDLTIFRKCGSLDSALFEFMGNVPADWDQSIDWGDGTAPAGAMDFSGGTVFHTYPIGEFFLVHTVVNPAGCSATRTYSVFNGSAPTLSLSGAGISACLPYSYEVSIPGTGVPIDYTVSFSDGTPSESFTAANDTLVAHAFQTTSCGETYVLGPGIPPILNAFSAAVMAENECSVGGIPTYATVGPFFISLPTQADLSQDLPNPVCQNQNITFTNESQPGETASSTGCNQDYSFYWVLPSEASVVSGSTGASNGAIGTNFNYAAWTSGSEQIEVAFASEGTFEVKVITANACGVDSATHVVEILPLGSVLSSSLDQDICTGESTTPFQLTSTVANYEIDWWLDDFDEVEEALIPATGSGIGPLDIPAWTPENPSDDIGSFVLYASVGCTDDPPTEVVFSVSPQGDIEPSAGQVDICSGTSPELDLGSNLPGATFTWSPQADLAIQGAQAGAGDAIDQTLSNNSTSNAAVIYTISIGGVTCPGPDLDVAVTVYPVLVLPDFQDLSACPGEQVTVVPVDPVEGATWSWDSSGPNIGIGNGGQGDVPTFQAASNDSNSPVVGTITVTGQVEDCPEVSASFLVTLHSDPTAQFSVTPNNGLDCITGEAVIHPEVEPANSLFTWSGPGNITNNMNQPTVDAVGTYSAEIQDPLTGCSAMFPVDVAPPVQVSFDDIDVENVSCSGGDDGRIALTATPDAGDLIWDWTPAVGEEGDAADLIAGSYLVSVSNASNCFDDMEVIVNEPEPLQAELIEVILSECGEANGLLKVEANGGLSPYDYRWSGEPNGETLDRIDAGSYDLTVRDRNGCEHDTTFMLDCIPLVPVEPFEFISPNGDGRNDVWVVEHLELYPENEVWVYNRWGKTVFHAHPYENDWGGERRPDAANEGNELPAATYFFVIDTKKKSQKPFKGILEIQYNEAP